MRTFSLSAWGARHRKKPAHHDAPVSHRTDTLFYRAGRAGIIECRRVRAHTRSEYHRSGHCVGMMVDPLLVKKLMVEILDRVSQYEEFSDPDAAPEEKLLPLVIYCTNRYYCWSRCDTKGAIPEWYAWIERKSLLSVRSKQQATINAILKAVSDSAKYFMLVRDRARKTTGKGVGTLATDICKEILKLVNVMTTTL
jgi:hypothetical protein